MLDKLLEAAPKKAEEWVDTWADVTFTPRRFFGRGTTNTTLTAVEFFLGTQVLAYFVLIAGSIGFWRIFFPERLAHHVRTHLLDAMTATATLFAAYAVLDFLLLMVASVISYGTAKAGGSEAKFVDHWRNHLHLAALEPLTTLGLAFLILADADDAVFMVGVALVVSARAWLLMAGFYATQTMHSLSKWRLAAVYFLGFVPTAVIMTSFSLCLLWFLVGAVLVGTWD